MPHPSSTKRSERRRVRRQILKQRSFPLFLAVLTVVSLAVTIFFAYNCSSPRPISSKLIFKKPANSILALNVLSQITMFCLAELAFCALDVLRWAFASRASGTPAYTFLALSRATNLAGVLCLMCGKGPNPGRFQPDGHKIWALQRHVRTVFALTEKNTFRTPSCGFGCTAPLRRVHPAYVH